MNSSNKIKFLIIILYINIHTILRYNSEKFVSKSASNEVAVWSMIQNL